VGVLALAGSSVPASLRIFLLALAVIDDLGAIAVIAIMFTEHLSWLALVLAAACLALLLAFNRAGVRRVWPYALVGVLLWLSVLKSGVHATLAGVALGFAIPLARAPRDAAARVERRIYPRVTFVILPLFALANAGVPLAQVTGEVLMHPVTLGIALGLLLGKFVGVFALTWLAVRWRFGALPAGVSWHHVAGVALLTGIGFTMSLFLGALALPDDHLQGQVRLGVLVGSTCAAIAGVAWLRSASRRRDAAGANLER
jgi:NhaA family Na+:H+ antiporter